MKKGLVLAGGLGTRLLPATAVLNKHMIPILNRPMILYPLETLKSFGITDAMVVTGGDHIGSIAEFLGDGSTYGVNLTYRVQKEAGGIAQALGLAKDFAGDDPIMVILGDNIFDNTALATYTNIKEPDLHAVIYIKEVERANRFGVYMQKETGLGTIIEKPADIQKGNAVTGLYTYPPDVFDLINTLVPSARGELEITDVNNHYLKTARCTVRTIHSFWSDAGTPESLKEVIDWAYIHHNGNQY